MEQSEIFALQGHLHPSMEPRDLAKLCFQAAHGGEHLLNDFQKAQAYFFEEWEQTAAADVPFTEPVSPRFVRLDLRAWKYHGLLPEWLFRIFAGSAQQQDDASIEPLLAEATQAVKANKFSFSPEQWQTFLKDYCKNGCQPLHHSEAYRTNEQPAYRIVNAEWTELLPILQAVCKQSKRPVVIAIDGMAASGKTTLADRLAQVLKASVIHMDDFFLPQGLRTAARYAEPGGNVHYERFKQEVLPHLQEQKDFDYGVFDCSTMEITKRRLVKGNDFYLIEGSYCLHPAFGPYAAVRLYLKIDASLQKERILKRNGQRGWEAFSTRWIPLEEKYARAFHLEDTNTKNAFL